MIGDTPARGRVLRLDALRVLLADREVTTAGDLAADLGVSLRTVQRDLVALRDLGMPIESERGRGGGIRLERGWSLGRVHLNEPEALGMLLSLTIAEKIGSPLLLEGSTIDPAEGQCRLRASPVPPHPRLTPPRPGGRAGLRPRSHELQNTADERYPGADAGLPLPARRVHPISRS